MPQVTVSRLAKRFGGVKAITDLTFDAEAGKILTVLGPSGSGKTTLLRCIAGLEIPDGGEISIGGAVVFSAKQRISVSPENREVGMVFQTYAIWPHMTVFDNIALPLKIRKKPKQEIEDRVRDVISLVKLGGLERRNATQLSGGQQQRVALARALVFEPAVLLLDEPLSSLDAGLREHMRIELREIQRQLAITTMYVTHDHSEAFALADELLVIMDGKRVAFGTPRELWEKPPNLSVANFLGHRNILPARLVERSREVAKVETPLGMLLLKIPDSVKAGDEFHICLRGRMITFHRSKPASGTNVTKGVLKGIVYRGGDDADYLISLNGFKVTVHGKTAVYGSIREGEEVYLEIPEDASTSIRK
jgi:iron(III) transport system ATP-binding protein